MAEQQKIKTSFPGLHIAGGATMDQLEVIPNPNNTDQPEVVDVAAAPTNNDSPANDNNQNLNTQAKPAVDQPATEGDEMSDEAFNKMLAKKSGGKYKTLEELTPTKQDTPEEIEAAKSKRKTEAHIWAIESGKTTKEKYDQAIKDSTRTDRDIALALFTTNLQEDDKNITSEEAAEIFADTFHESAEENSRLRKTGQSQIEKIAAQYRKENFAFLDEIEPEYNEIVEAQNQYQGYKGRVKEIGDKIPKTILVEVPYTDVDGNAVTLKHEFAVDDSAFKKVLDEVRSQSSFTIKNVTTNGKITDKDVETDILNRIKAATYDNAIKSMYEAGLKKGEERAVVIMGNKRNNQQTLNDGVQKVAQPEAKLNEYPHLKKAQQEQGR